MKKCSNVWAGLCLAAGLSVLFPHPAAGQAEVSVSFETGDFASVGVYDRWEESPFRGGPQRLEGNVAVVRNHLQETDGATGVCPNATGRMLGFQRSRFGSNVFGARVDLAKPFATSDAVKYVHVFLHRPVAGRVMLVGLGRRSDDAGQPAETEQFWVFSADTVAVGRWADAVFPVRTADGVEVHSLVVVPYCESPHGLAEDFAVFIDEIVVNDDETPRVSCGDGSGVAPVSREEGLAVEADEGMIRLRAAEECRYVVCDGSGRVLHSGSLEGERSFRLDPGVYVVNGRKVAVP